MALMLDHLVRVIAKILQEAPLDGDRRWIEKAVNDILATGFEDDSPGDDDPPRALARRYRQVSDTALWARVREHLLLRPEFATPAPEPEPEPHVLAPPSDAEVSSKEISADHQDRPAAVRASSAEHGMHEIHVAFRTLVRATQERLLDDDNYTHWPFHGFGDTLRADLVVLAKGAATKVNEAAASNSNQDADAADRLWSKYVVRGERFEVKADRSTAAVRWVLGQKSGLAEVKAADRVTVVAWLFSHTDVPRRYRRILAKPIADTTFGRDDADRAEALSTLVGAEVYCVLMAAARATKDVEHPTPDDKGEGSSQEDEESLRWAFEAVLTYLADATTLTREYIEMVIAGAVPVDVETLLDITTSLGITYNIEQTRWEIERPADLRARILRASRRTDIRKALPRMSFRKLDDLIGVIERNESDTWQGETPEEFHRSLVTQKSLGPRAAPPRGKYSPLFAELDETPGDDAVSLNFEQIRQKLGFPLPPSAKRPRTGSSWWNSGNLDKHPHQRAWLAAGYTVTVDWSKETVNFKPLPGRQLWRKYRWDLRKMQYADEPHAIPISELQATRVAKSRDTSLQSQHLREERSLLETIIRDVISTLSRRRRDLDRP